MDACRLMSGSRESLLPEQDGRWGREAARGEGEGLCAAVSGIDTSRPSRMLDPGFLPVRRVRVWADILSHLLFATEGGIEVRAQVQYSPPGTIREKQLRLLPRNPRWATLVVGCWAAQRLAQSPGTQAYHNLRRVFCTYLHGVFLAYCYLTRGEGLRYTGQRGCGMGRPSCTGYSMLIIYPLLLPPYIYLYL
jgi:hypothetical protein